jgi:hypothetical protein
MYSNILNLLNNFTLIGNNLDVDFYNNKFKNQLIKNENIKNENIKNENIKNENIKNENIKNENIKNENIKYKNEVINKKQQFANEEQLLNKKSDIYIVRQKDSLFWSFYIMKYGLFNYEINVVRQSFFIEKQEKFKYIDLIRQNKELLKLHKIKNLSSLENELANENIISIKTFICMCIIENLNIYLINDRKLYINVLDDTLPINIILKNKNKPYYCIDFQVSEEKINNYKENYLIMSSFDNNLKSINSYKVNELLDICRKLDLTISSDEKLNKKYLYELISKNY